MSIIEWFWAAVVIFGALTSFRAWRAKMDFHGSGMARMAGVWIGIYIAGFGAVALLVALAI